MALTPSERKDLAVKVGVNEQYLYQCLTGRRDMDPVEAIRIERDSGRQVTRFDLCQRRGADIWPELATRPAAFSDLPSGVRDQIATNGMGM